MQVYNEKKEPSNFVICNLYIKIISGQVHQTLNAIKWRKLLQKVACFFLKLPIKPYHYYAIVC